jgi:hypothetical protein
MSFLMSGFGCVEFPKKGTCKVFPRSLSQLKVLLLKSSALFIKTCALFKKTSALLAKTEALF